MSVLLERNGHMDRLSELLSAARDGKGSLVWVSGEAGAGKSSLMKAFAKAVRGTADVFSGSCDPLVTPRPLGPVLDFADELDTRLRGLIAELPPVEVSAEILNRLRNRARPALLIIEDVHWADDSTLDMIRFLGRRIAESNGLVICTYRDEEVGSGHPVAVIMGQLATMDGIDRLSVGALSIAAVAELATGSDHESVYLHEITGGNAFFVTELLATDGGVPSSVQDAVLARVERLNPELRPVVESVSVSPGGLEVDLTIELSGCSLIEVDRALGSGILNSDGHTVSFRHELARRAVEESLGQVRRVAMSRQLLDLLETTSKGDLARLAHHAIESGSAESIARYVPDAAEAALSKNAYRTAVRLWEAALARPDYLDADRVAELHLKTGSALYALDLATDAIAHIQVAIAHYRETDQPVALGQALTELADVYIEISDVVRFREVIDEAIGILEGEGNTIELGEAYVVSCYAYVLSSQRARALEAGRRASQVAETVGDLRTKYVAERLMVCAMIVTGDPDQGLEDYNAVLDEAARNGVVFTHAGERNFVAAMAAEVKRFEFAAEAADTSTRLATDANILTILVCDRAWAARMAFDQGRYDEAIEHAEGTERLAGNMFSESVVKALAALGRTRVRRGEEGGRQIIENALQRGVSQTLRIEWPLWAGLAEHSWLWGKGGSVPDLIGPAYQRALAADSPWARGELGFWMWRVGAIDGPPEHSAEPFQLQMSGDWEGAARAWRSIGCPYEVGLALMDGDESAQLEALAMFDSLGARPVASLLRSSLRSAGVIGIPRGPLKETVSNPWQLTSRQLEVAMLLADGLTNGEIAERLFVSKKTVENHVAAVFAKLGVQSRAEVVSVTRELEAVG